MYVCMCVCVVRVLCKQPLTVREQEMLQILHRKLCKEQKQYQDFIFAQVHNNANDRLKYFHIHPDVERYVQVS